MKPVLYLSSGLMKERMLYASQLLVGRMGGGRQIDCCVDSKKDEGLDLNQTGFVPASMLDEIFRCATLQRETESGLRDSLGRFPELIVPWDISKPWISLLASALLKRDSPTLDGRVPENGCFSVIITHDIDEVTGLEPTALVKTLLHTIGLHEMWPEFKLAMSAKKWIANLERLLQVEKDNKVGAYYFMLSGPYGLRRHSSRYDARWAQSKRIAQAISSAGMAVGLHGSYYAREEGSYATERAHLEEAIGKPVNCHRNHYLRFDAVRLWDELEGAGIQYDFSVGFSRRMGFRAGMATVYQAYSMTARRPSAVKAVPLLFSDGILHHGDVRGAIKKLRLALGEVSRCRGCVCLLFHPEAFMIDDKIYAVFEEVLQICKDMGADMSGNLLAAEPP